MTHAFVDAVCDSQLQSLYVHELSDVALEIRRDIAVDMCIDVKFSSRMLIAFGMEHINPDDFDVACREVIGEFIAKNPSCDRLVVSHIPLNARQHGCDDVRDKIQCVDVMSFTDD